ncbi:hypothetical protein BDN72DRAFT_864059 [Pluteus cervinus]|uniref:Uncharacterized protein n=1 Tax=Pluteus cervinus TaxID=181527 RepID=A0ACD3A562_9AGAR|nr:hypothetical protein BDN72DRAFT_864059 [Pluteus cervinus]
MPPRKGKKKARDDDEWDAAGSDATESESDYRLLEGERTLYPSDAQAILDHPGELSDEAALAVSSQQSDAASEADTDGGLEYFDDNSSSFEQGSTPPANRVTLASQLEARLTTPTSPTHQGASEAGSPDRNEYQYTAPVSHFSAAASLARSRFPSRPLGSPFSAGGSGARSRFNAGGSSARSPFNAGGSSARSPFSAGGSGAGSPFSTAGSIAPVTPTLVPNQEIGAPDFSRLEATLHDRDLTLSPLIFSGMPDDLLEEEGSMTPSQALYSTFLDSDFSFSPVVIPGFLPSSAATLEPAVHETGTPTPTSSVSPTPRQHPAIAPLVMPRTPLGLNHFNPTTEAHAAAIALIRAMRFTQRRQAMSSSSKLLDSTMSALIIQHQHLLVLVSEMLVSEYLVNHRIVSLEDLGIPRQVRYLVRNALRMMSTRQAISEGLQMYIQQHPGAQPEELEELDDLCTRLTRDLDLALVYSPTTQGPVDPRERT